MSKGVCGEKAASPLKSACPIKPGTSEPVRTYHQREEDTQCQRAEELPRVHVDEGEQQGTNPIATAGRVCPNNPSG